MRPLLAASTFLRLLSTQANSRRLFSSATGFTCTVWEPSSDGLELTVRVTFSFDRVYEEFIGILRRAQRPAVYRDQIVAFLHGYARFGER